MHIYICIRGKRKRQFTSQHQLKQGDIVIANKGRIYMVESEIGGKRCLVTKSVKIAPEEYVRNAVLLQETWKRESKLNGQFVESK